GGAGEGDELLVLRRQVGHGPIIAERQDGPMTAYWISNYREVLDTDKLAAYAKLAGPALVEAGGRFLARETAAQVYEDGVAGRTVIIEFDSVEAAIAAHDSPAYQEALVAFDGGAVRDLRIV